MGAIATMTREGQVTVPAEVRERLGLQEGGQVEFVLEAGKTVLQVVRVEEDVFEKWRGAARGSFKSQEEVNAWVREMRGYDEGDL